MSTRQPNQYGAALFPPPEGAFIPYWDHIRLPPRYDPPVQPLPNFTPQHCASPSCTGARLGSTDQDQASRADWTPRQEPTEGKYTEFSEPTGHEQQPGNAPVTSHTDFHPFQGDSGNNVGSLLGEGMSQANPSDSADWPATLLFVHPPPNQLVPHSAPQNQQVTQAFTPSSRHPNVVLRWLLDCFLHSKWMHDQDCEPKMMDDYSKYVLYQVVNLNGCPPIDFSNPRKSLLTVFVGRQGGRHSCLICEKAKDSIPCSLSCVRSHLQLKPFQCEGCRSCNEKNGHASFWSAALLRDHLSGQKMVTCAEWQRREVEAGKHPPPLGYHTQEPATFSWTSSIPEAHFNSCSYCRLPQEELLNFLLEDGESA